jgi:peptide-methionine (R)-S-oxide reductase
MNRRAFFISLGFATAGLFAWKLGRDATATVSGAGPAPEPAKPRAIQIEEFTDAGVSKGIVQTQTIVLTDAEWKQKLSPDSYEVTRRHGTERAFTGQYDHFNEKGVYRCICCDTALYSSRTKFDSGTGWPSFWAPISKENVSISTDLSLGMERDEVSCKKCDAHLGHVFDDGPRPTGQRYCMNSVALRFAKAPA